MGATQEAYGRLLYETRPAIIETEAQYHSVSEQLSSLVRRGRSRTPEETRFMKLLAVLVGEYDRRNALPPSKMAPKEALRFLLEHSGKRPADLIPVFGQRSHVNEALNGKRKIGARQAQKLAKIFNVNPGIFL